MKLTMLLTLALAFFGGYPKTPDAKLIDRLDQAVQRRFAAPPAQLGMSRVATPASFGRHFQPAPGAVTDFVPENREEQDLVRELQAGSLKVGFYVFGAAVLQSPPERRDFRALKGPAVVTANTLRPAWYPPVIARSWNPHTLPDWTTIYPMAHDAMKRFERGSSSVESEIGDWHVVVRPVPASSAQCVGCHNNPAIGRSLRPVAMRDTIGGVLYAWRK